MARSVTRVHLEEVEGLGRFVELEIALEDAKPSSGAWPRRTV